MPNPFKVSLYIRVSTDKQANEGDSLDEQERELKRYCEFKGYLIHHVHIEPGRSAKNTKRPEYQKLMSDIEAEKINAVVVKKLDRLSRSLLDFEEFMTLAQKHKVEFISIKENFDTTNAMGTAMLRVALVFAQLEREQTSERIRDVMAYRAEQGLNNGGLRPYGYCSINKELIPDKIEKKMVEFIYDKFLETKSTALVARELNAMGSRNRNGMLWDKRRVMDILKRPAYIGMVDYKGTFFKGIHQPIITESKYYLVQDIFKSRSALSTRNKIGGMLKGLIICGYCGNNLWPNYTRKKSGKEYFYYRCSTTIHKTIKFPSCVGQYLPFEQVHTLLISHILTYATEAKLKLIQSEIEQSNAGLNKAIKLLTAEQGRFEAALEILKQKKERYLDSLVSGQFSQGERKKINDKIDEFSLEEKQVQSAIYRCQFELSEKTGNLRSIEPFKQAIIQFKINYETMTEADLGKWLHSNIEQISIKGNELETSFKSLSK